MYDFQWTAIKSTAANDMTGTAVITGLPGLLYGCPRCDFQCIWTGTPTGVFTFQVCDYPGSIFNADQTAVSSSVTWTTLTNPAAFTALQPAGAAGSAVFGFADLASRWIRPIYTNTSGTGTLTFVYGSAKR